jgi:tetratricopeptide (TPR) repeat protein
MRMALAASTGNDSEASIGYLKRAIALDDRMAEPHYLLGAEYAGKGSYDLAVSEMQAALARKPELAAARFQLGLLFLTLARVEEAATTWGLLDMLPHEHPLYLFKSGLLHMIQERFDKAAMFLKEGIAGNSENPALNRDMQLLLEEISRKQAEASGAAIASAADAQHFLVSSYRKH